MGTRHERRDATRRLYKAAKCSKPEGILKLPSARITLSLLPSSAQV